MAILPIQLLTVKAAVVLVWFVSLFMAERFYPASSRPVADRFGNPVDWRRNGRNLGLWLINSLTWPVIVLPVTLWAIEHQIRIYGPSQPAWWVLNILILDLWLYWWHRANHRWSFLWRFHRVHHLDSWLDTTSAVRFHFGELWLSALARVGVIFLLGIPLISVLVYETLVLMCTLFHHSNLRLPVAVEKKLSGLIITPGIHWIHHHAVKSDTDSNYGTLFSFWDRLFDTFSKTVRSPDIAIGIEGQPELTMERLLVLPFMEPKRNSLTGS